SGPLEKSTGQWACQRGATPPCCSSTTQVPLSVRLPLRTGDLPAAVAALGVQVSVGAGGKPVVPCRGLREPARRRGGAAAESRPRQRPAGQPIPGDGVAPPG